MKTTEFSLTTTVGNLIRGSHFEPPAPPTGAPSGKSRKLIIYAHGFKGFKDWGFVPFAGEYFASNGFHFVSFNFSHNGVGEDLLNFTELDRFAENTFSLELDELGEVIEFCSNGKLASLPAPLAIGLIGHSRGGGIAILEGTKNDAVNSIVTWASVAGFEKLVEWNLDQWREQGYVEISNSRTGQILRCNYSLAEDILKHKDDKLNVVQAVFGSNKAICFIHGEDDEAIPVSDARKLFDAAEYSFSELHIHPGTGHTFGCKHPFAGSNEIFDEVLEQTASFFSRTLD